MATPLVTIRCLVYNHEPYLRQCLDGFVMQKTNFPFEAIVHDDASTDRSAEIIREYAEKYPNIIKPIFETENLYSKHDGSIRKVMYEHTKGKYVAICEGDDYWIDPYKLQKQVDILESNTNIGLCYTSTKVYNQKRKVFQSNISVPYINFQSLLLHNPITTLTVMYRKDLYDSYLKEIIIDNKKWLMGDYPLWLWISSQKDIFFISDVTAVYRYLENSASHSHGNIQKQLAFNDSIRNVRLYFIDKLCLDGNLISLVNDDYYRRNVYNGIINNDRSFCLENIKKISTPSFRDKVNLILCYSPLLFKLLTYRNK
jgi:glycosyltransferase involved in cell wall biosynthesis